MAAGFHVGAGVYARRTVDGGVLIYRASGAPPVTPMLELSASEWASLVASVSATGETTETYADAVSLHRGRCRRVCPHGSRCRLEAGHVRDVFPGTNTPVGCNHAPPPVGCDCNGPNVEPQPN